MGGTASAVLSLLMIRRNPPVAVLGAVSLSFWVFFARGGEIISFYLVPVLPVLALNLALLLNVILRGAARALHIQGGPVAAVATAALCALCLLALIPGYRSPASGYDVHPFELWTSPQADAQVQALAWVQANVPPDSRIIIDQYMWTDLHDPSTGFPMREAHYYWKLDRDPEIREGVFHGDWRTVDYIVTTPQMVSDAKLANLTLVAQALLHSEKIAKFDSGGWPVVVRRVSSSYSAASDPDLQALAGLSHPAQPAQSCGF